MRLYVGGFPYATTKEELIMLFSEVGEVTDVHLPLDKETRRPRGFGFVEMPEEAARAAIERFHGTEFGGRKLTVNEAQPREERPDRPPRQGGFQQGGDRQWDRPAAPQHDAAPAAMPAAEADMPAEEHVIDMPAADTEDEA